MRPSNLHLRLLLAPLAMTIAVAAARAESMDDGLQEDDPLVARITVCHGYGCAVRTGIHLFESDVAAVRDALAASLHPADERHRIGRAVGLMEEVVATRVPTSNDLPGNEDQHRPGAPEGQLDCIDESTNTSTYLALFERLGWLRWHRVAPRILRAPLLIDQHWAAQIEDTGSGHRFAVDSWVRGNGEPAIVQPLDDWRRDRPVGAQG